LPQIIHMMAGAVNLTPFMRDILSAAEGSSDLWLPAHGASRSIANAMAEYGWIEATPKGDRVYIQLTDAGRAVLASMT
jgi:hypothetical protein